MKIPNISELIKMTDFKQEYPPAAVGLATVPVAPQPAEVKELALLAGEVGTEGMVSPDLGVATLVDGVRENIAAVDPQEIEKFQALDRCLQKFVDKKSSTLLEILRFNIPKQSKQETMKNLIDIRIFDRDFVDPQDSFGPGYINSEYLSSVHQLITLYCQYFGPLVDDIWYRETMGKISSACLRPFALDLTESNHLADVKLWSDNLDLAEKIHGSTPVENFDALKRKGILAISKTLAKNMKREYFGSDQENPLKKDPRIITLATKNQIELPTEEEVWTRDVAEAIQKSDSSLAEKENEQRGERFVYGLLELKVTVNNSNRLLLEAGIKFPLIILPEGYTTIEQTIAGFQERYKAIIINNFTIEINKYCTDLDIALASGEPKVKGVMQGFIRFIRENVVVEKIDLSPIVLQLEKLLEQQESRIRTILAEIQDDLLKGEERGKELVIRLGILRDLSDSKSQIEGINQNMEPKK